MKNSLNPLAAGLTVGIFWGLSFLLGTWLAIKTNIGETFLNNFVDAYPNFELSMTGSFWGLLWGFIDGFLGGYILVWLYNFIARKLK